MQKVIITYRTKSTGRTNLLELTEHAGLLELTRCAVLLELTVHTILLELTKCTGLRASSVNICLLESKGNTVPQELKGRIDLLKNIQLCLD